MKFLAFVFIAVLCGVEAKTKARIVLEKTREIDQLKINVTNVFINETLDLAQIRIDLGKALRQTRGNLKAQLKSLDQTVQSAINDAAETGRDINACVAQERSERSNIDLSQLNSCDESPIFDLIQAELVSLGAVAVSTASFIPSCGILHPLNNKQLEQCIEDDIQAAYKQAWSIQDKERKEIADTRQKAVDCANSSYNDLSAVISAVQSEFQACVSAVPQPTQAPEPWTTEEPAPKPTREY